MKDNIAAPVGRGDDRRELTLTGNELAIAANACAHAINWVKAQGRSKWWRAERLKFEALNRKLQEISQHAYPYEQSNESPLDFGDEPIMKVDDCEVSKTRAAAAEFNRLYGYATDDAEPHIAERSEAPPIHSGE